MKSKKGFMLGEYTLKMIIAVLCILLLMYLLFSLYSKSKDQRNLQLAEASLNELVKGMEEAKKSGSAEVLILNPQKGWINFWWVIVWPFGEKKEKPLKCNENYCICICEAHGDIENSLKNCNSFGVCKNFNERIEIINLGFPRLGGTIPIKTPPVGLKVQYENKVFKIIEEK